jgi:hypothetical protein
MTTDMQLIPVAVLDEAVTIVEAEWMHLTQDWELWERELDGFLAELPMPGSRRQRSCPTAVGCRPPTGLSPRARSVMSQRRRSPASTVRATQRSPPAATPGPTISQMFAINGEVMP